MVHDLIIERGYRLGYERKDPYVRDLMSFIPKGLSRKKSLIYRLLLAGMIEARSCERFRVLSENIEDQELSKFYADLMKSEAQHYTMFLKFARKYGEDILNVNELWEEFLAFEAEIMRSYGKTEQIHG